MCFLGGVKESGTIQNFFCRQTEHGDLRASPSEIKSALEMYIGKFANGIAEANILLALNFMFKAHSTIEEQGNLDESGHGVKNFPQAPAIDSETGHRVLCENEDICLESSESSIYLMQNLQVGDSNCLTFFDSGVNTHLIDGQLARSEELQLISRKDIALGVIGGGSIRTEYGGF